MLEELKNEIAGLKMQISNLQAEFYKNNFKNSQTFNKAVICNDRLRVPVYSSAPAVAEIGDLISVSAKLYICTVAGTVSSPATFSLVGTQS